MKLKGIILCAIFVVSVCTQRVYASEYDVGFTYDEESQADDVTHGEEAQADDVTHDEESQADDVTHGEESQADDVTHGEESQTDDVTHSEESQTDDITHSEELQTDDITHGEEDGEENEYSTDDYTDSDEDYEDITECNGTTDKDAPIQSADILDKDYIGDYRSFSLDTIAEDEIGYLSVIATTLTDMHITIIVQNIIICAFLIYIFVSRMTRMR